MIYLYTAEEIVRYSFLVQKSITPLDLSTLEYSQLTPTPCTEASFQKLFGVNDRRVLFEYHLDVSQGLQKAMKEYDLTWEFVSCVFRDVEKLLDTYYYPCIHHGIVEAIEKSRDKTAELRKFLPLMKMIHISSEYFGEQEFSYFARILQEECTDSEVVAEFIEICGRKNVREFLVWREKIGHEEYFLCHSQKMKIDLQFERDPWCPVSKSLFMRKFKRAIALIKYGKMRQTLKDNDICLFILNLSGVMMNCMKFNTRNNGERTLCSDQLNHVKKGLLLLLVSVFFYRVEYERCSALDYESPDLGIDALRLMSRSLPESYLTLSEIRSVWKQDSDLRLDQPTAAQFYAFYETEIMDGGSQHFDVEEPRSLKHLARCEIRGRLAANWALPDGIPLLGLPQPVQGFLRLES